MAEELEADIARLKAENEDLHRRLDQERAKNRELLEKYGAAMIDRDWFERVEVRRMKDGYEQVIRDLQEAVRASSSAKL